MFNILLDKLKLIFDFMFSSYLGVELFIFILFFLLFLILNSFIKFRVGKVISMFLLLLPLILLFFIDKYFIVSTIENFIILIMQLIFFPTIVMYFFIVCFTFIWMVYTILSRSISRFKRISNYIVLLFMFYCYFSIFSICYLENISVFEKSDIYSNNLLVSFIQVGNIVLTSYLIFNFFYYLYIYFKRFDKKIEN